MDGYKLKQWCNGATDSNVDGWCNNQKVNLPLTFPNQLVNVCTPSPYIRGGSYGTGMQAHTFNKDYFYVNTYNSRVCDAFWIIGY